MEIPHTLKDFVQLSTPNFLQLKASPLVSFKNLVGTTNAAVVRSYFAAAAPTDTDAIKTDVQVSE